MKHGLAGRAAGFVESHYPHLVAVALAAAALHAWLRRFVTDDAFISFRYARNLVEGHGLVFNPGERVEGYTNFLWTVWMAVPHIAGLDPILFCHVIGPLLAALSVWFTCRAALALTGSRPAALLAGVLLATNPSFAAWATGGLETQLLTCIQAAFLALTLATVAGGAPVMERSLGLSLLAAAALMTRLDSALVVAIAMAVVWFQSRTAPHRRPAQLAALLAPVAVVIGAWLAWKLSYYGEILPNTVHAKTDLAGSWRSGVAYLGVFLQSYLLWPVLILFALAFRSLAGSSAPAAATILSMLCAQSAYTAWVGGDFMEFRLMVPLMPVAFVMIAWLCSGWLVRPLARAGLVLLVVAGAVHHTACFTYTRGIESTEGLAAHLYDPAGDWVGVGRALGRDLDEQSDLRIAVTAAGAIPYYSRLPALDMLGLNDRWVARHGLLIEAQPGHHRLVPFSRLVSEGIHLVVAHPWIAAPSAPGRTAYAYEELSGLRYLADSSPPRLPPGAAIVEAPLDPRRVLVALYLTPHPAVQALIASGRWRRFAVSPPD